MGTSQQCLERILLIRSSIRHIPEKHKSYDLEQGSVFFIFLLLMNNTIQTVDIEKALREKNPGLYKMLPRFVLNYIKRIAHQNDLNRLLTTYGPSHKGVDFARMVLKDLNVGYDIIHPERLPDPSGRYIFASNHPLGGLDGVVLIDAIGARYPEVKFIVNDLLLHLAPLESVFVPVNKHGRQSSAYATCIDQVYASDAQVLYFPAGLCSRKIKGLITDPVWKKSFINKAINYQRNIVPIYFEARNSDFFYNLANIRKFFGIKANLEMFYLSDELFKQRGAHFRIHIGAPIPYTMFDLKEGNLDYWTKYVRQCVYRLFTNRE